MLRRILSSVFVGATVSICAAFSLSAQTDTGFSPYSIYGVGEMCLPGGSHHNGMAGVGIAARNNRFINFINPAAVTARDTLSFMADFSLKNNNKLFKQGDIRSANNTFNVNDLVMSFPIWKSSAMMVGVRPYSSVGYSHGFYYEDPDLLGRVGNVGYSAVGKGGIYQAFAAAGVTFWDRLSLGAQFNLYFGEILKEYTGTFSNASYNGIKNGYEITVSAPGIKAGLQYEQPIGDKSSITFGATYDFQTKIKGQVNKYSLSSATASTDTLIYRSEILGDTHDVRFAGEMGLGIAFRFEDKLRFEFDYTRADWRTSGFDTFDAFRSNAKAVTVDGQTYSSFTSTVSESFRLGAEYVPNRNDIRYYMNQVTYRAGVYYKTDYFLMDGEPLVLAGITVGATFPVFRWYNGLTVAMELGQRGKSVQNGMIRERYVNFTFGMNIHDIWFQKPRYE